MQDHEKIINGLRISIAEGALAHAFANLTGSLFLPAFAILLGANAFQIGLLASVQFFATLAQLPGAVLVERLTHRKKIAVSFSFCARALWLPLIVYGLYTTADSSKENLLNLLIILVIVYHVLASISGVSWLSWMSALVPDEIRGRFFGLRNSILGMMTIIVTIGGGFFLDWFPKIFPDQPRIISFYLLFAVAVISGLSSAILLSRQIEPNNLPPFTGRYLQLFTEPIRNTNFRRLLTFAFFWSFAVNFAAPFYIVYMLKDLSMSYTLISSFTVLSAVADLTGMGIWGHYSDRVGNRPIMILTAGMAALLPFFWIFTTPHPLSIYFFIPALHLLGGFVVSGFNLTSVNLIFRSVPAGRNSIYFAFWAAFNGIMAGCGALTGGYVATHATLPLALFGNDPGSVFKLIFLISCGMRVFSLIFLIRVKEAKGKSVLRVIRVLRSVRSWSSMMGYHPVLQFFLPVRSRRTEHSPYWPIWRRAEKDSANN